MAARQGACDDARDDRDREEPPDRGGERREHLGLFEAWRQDRGALDEIGKLWDPKLLDCCLGKENNVALVGPGYPASEVWCAGKSFYDTVDRMGECPDLVEMLARTYTSASP